MAEFEVWLTRTGKPILNLRSAYANASHYGYLLTNPDQLLDPGSVVWRRNTVTSPFVDGDLEVHATKSAQSVAFSVLILDAVHSGIQQKLADLIEALSQRVYELHIRMENLVEYAWQCRRADYGVGITRRVIHGHSMEVKISAPRRALSIQGPI